MRWQEIWAIARAEMRLTRRLVRYWAFLAIAYAVGAVAWLYYSFLHAFFSSFSATVASINPRYLLSVLGFYYLIVFMVGLVFLGFDVRARDVRERMVEVLDARPVSNLELLTGRFVGVLIMSWVPVVGIAVLLQLLGVLLQAVGAPLGGTLNVASLVGFVGPMALPAFAFVLALTYLVAVVVRNRLMSAVLLLLALGALLVGLWWVPLVWTPMADISGQLGVAFPSDVLPMVATWDGWLQRLGVLIASVGLLVLAAAVYPRLDGGSRAHRAGAAGLALVLAIGCLAGATAARVHHMRAMDRWAAAHSDRLAEPYPDLESIAGSVEIDPGHQLALDLELTLAAPPGAALETALLSFNPGLAVRSVAGADGDALQFVHADGLLEVELGTPLAPGERTQLQLQADGEPNLGFGYLDSVKRFYELTPRDGQLMLLGYDKAIFDRRFVALMPGIHWLPTPGPDVGRDDPRRRPTDFYEVDLEVSAPEAWLVAGPGRREGQAGGFRFQPGAPVDQVALVASRFEAVSATIGDVHGELLLSPGHTDNLEVLAEASNEITEWLAERYEATAQSGLTYPYTGYTLVEVPTTLRSYGGGWRLDTTLAPAGMLLVRESGFPTARFERVLRNRDELAEQEGGVPRALRRRVQMFFENDFSGGNPFVAFARSCFLTVTGPEGPNALALEFVTENMAAEVVTGTRGYFSAHLFSPELQQVIGRTLGAYFGGGRQRGSFVDSVIRSATERPEVWSTVLTTSLRDLEPREDPQRSLDVLTLKGGAVAESVVDTLGADAAGRLLASLRQQHRGASFTVADVERAAAELGLDLTAYLDEWLGATNLPGFQVADVRAYRLADGDDGSARYQLALVLRNDEPVAGVASVLYGFGRPGEEGPRRGRGRGRGGPPGSPAARAITIEWFDPIYLEGQSAVELGVVVPEPPVHVAVDPYLALNRETFIVDVPEVDEQATVDAEVIEGVQPVPWEPTGDGTIVVDDLDPGFSVENPKGRDGLRISARGQANGSVGDAGLPALELRGSPPVQWARWSAAPLWGRYRHTAALARAGDGDGRALFTASLPSSGSWELEVHLPRARGFPLRRWELGTVHLEVIRDGQSMGDASIDAGAAPRGWNLVDSWSLDSGEVTVALSNQSDGEMVVADAIRWVPATGTGEAP
jgi:ABC-type transport system involved in multi-copper enzyme maturation permease subunit